MSWDKTNSIAIYAHNLSAEMEEWREGGKRENMQIGRQYANQETICKLGGTMQIGRQYANWDPRV